MTLGRLRSEMDSAEYTEWRALSMVEPVGPRRLDMLLGQLLVVVGSMFRHTPPKLSDACYWIPPVKIKRQTPEEVVAAMKKMASVSD
jgi:hypothetical protein